MAIKLNGVEITVNRLNGTDITEESINGTKVYPINVPATAWQYTSPTQDFVQEFEVESFINNPQLEGCGFGTSNLPPASNYFVGDSIRGRLNTPSSTCPTWIYFEAIFEEEKEWVYLFNSTSSNELTSIIIEQGYFGGDINQMQDYITSVFPPDNYDVGRVIVVYDYDTGYYYYFQVGQK